MIKHLPPDFQPVATFAYLTGWRWVSEVLPLTWAQVDFDAEEVRLEPGTAKNGKGRTYPFSDGLRDLLTTQRTGHDELKQTGRICPLVFQSNGQALPEATFVKAWQKARKAAGVPGCIMHDSRKDAALKLNDRADGRRMVIDPAKRHPT